MEACGGKSFTWASGTDEIPFSTALVVTIFDTHLSNVTVGTPNVELRSAASAPPKLCPVSQIVDVG